MTSPDPTADTSVLLDMRDMLVDLTERVGRLERAGAQAQMPHTALDGTALVVKDKDGTVRSQYGWHGDGVAALTYAEGGPAPSTPTAPLVQENQLSAAVGWDGKFVGDAPALSNHKHVNIHVSTDQTAGANFEATEVNARQTLGGPDEIADIVLAANVKHWIKLVAVSHGNVRSAASAAVEVTPQPVSDLAAESVTVDTLAALLQLTGKRIVAGDPEGDHLELSEEGLFLAKGDGSILFYLQASGAVLSTGEYRTRDSGERIVINPGGSDPDGIRGYPAVGEGFGKLTSYTAGNGDAGWEMSSGTETDGEGARLWLDPVYGQLEWRRTASGLVYTEVFANEFFAGMKGPVVDIAAKHAHPTSSGSHRIAFFHVDSDGDIYPNALIEYVISGGDNTALFRNGGKDLSMLWGFQRMYFKRYNASTAAPISAASFDIDSGREVKSDIARPPQSLLTLASAAPVNRWRYTAEGPTGRYRFGPMADELPPELVTATETGPQVDIGGIASLSLGALQELVEVVMILAQRLELLETS